MCVAGAYHRLMGKVLRRYGRLSMLPAVAVILLLTGLWIWARWGYLSGGAWEVVGASVFTGWLAMMFLVTTVAAIFWTAAAPDQAAGALGNPAAGGRAADAGSFPAVAPVAGMYGELFLGFAILLDGCGVLLLCVGLSSGLIGLWDIARVYLLLAAWAGMWAGVTWALRQAGARALGAVLSFAVSMLLFAGPVTAVPLARAAAGSGAAGGAMQEAVLRVIAVLTPMLGALDAVTGSMRVGWAQLPEMYRLSVFGQDIPLGLPRWWVSVLVYAGMAMAAWLIGRMVGGREEG